MHTPENILSRWLVFEAHFAIVWERATHGLKACKSSKDVAQHGSENTDIPSMDVGQGRMLEGWKIERETEVSLSFIPNSNSPTDIARERSLLLLLSTRCYYYHQ